MQNLPLYTNIEFQNIFNFLKETWTFPNGFTNDDVYHILKTVYDEGLKAGNDFCDSQKLNDLVIKLKNSRNKFLDKNHSDIMEFDSLHNLLICFKGGQSFFDENSKKDFNSFYDKKVKECFKSVYLSLNQSYLYPKGYGLNSNKSYKEIREIYNEHDDLGYWDKTNNGESEESLRLSKFKGVIFKKLAAFDFVFSTSLHNVLYSDVCQGRSPLKSLVMDIFNYGINVSEYNNTIDTFNYFKSLKIKNEFYREKIEIPDIPFLKACLKVNKYETLEVLSDDRLSSFQLLKKDFEILSVEDKILYKELEDAKKINKIRVLLLSFVSHEKENIKLSEFMSL